MKTLSMNDYCEKHEHNVPCRLTGRNTTPGFCQIGCKKNPERFKARTLDQMRNVLRPPLTEEQKADEDIVSLCIPVCDADKAWIMKTLQNVLANAVGTTEILLENDDNHEGHRVLMNRMAAKAKGKYLLRLDAHCAMSPGWDARMKSSCDEKTIVVAMVDALNTKTWGGSGIDMGLIILNDTMDNTYPPWKGLAQRDIEEPTMGLGGCNYMIQKDHYWYHEGCDEELGIREAGGLEWALKAWLTGGRVIIRTDVVCCHLFRAPEIGVNNAVKDRDATLMLAKKWATGYGKGQIYGLYWLARKFEPWLNWDKKQELTLAKGK